MSWSATEVSALAAKAARGAGAPPDQAARFGTAAAFHLMIGNAPQDLRLALQALPDGGPVMRLPVVLDEAVSEGGRVFEMLPPDALVRAYVAVLPFAATLAAADNDHWRVSVNVTKPAPKIEPLRITGCADLIDEMTGLAARTFVPESAASRAAGAGAGLTDND
ncbi:hypothetical protein [Roseobacter sp. S98]|uniref:hypothetical protein n=1 Tax=Roseobacter algicola (ex Choi et al. 2025) (nom. illeg.) TaxID=3092138 RepID=UPI00389582FA